MPKKKICYLITGYDSGGAKTSLIRLYNRYIDNKYEIVLAAEDSKQFFAKELIAKGISVKDVNLNYSKKLTDFINKKNKVILLYKLIVALYIDIRKLKEYITTNDIAILHTHYVHHHILSCFINKKVKKVWHIRAFVNDKSLLGFSKFFFNVALLLFPDKIIFISEVLQRSFIKQLNKKSEVIYNGLEKNVNNKDNSSLFNRLIGNNKGKIIIGTVGRFVPIKGFEDFIKMANNFKINNNVLFVLIGSSSSDKEKEYKNKIVSLIHSLSLEDKVLILGEFENSSYFMPSIDILVHPNIQFEGFGNVILEAQMQGIPVITTDCGGPTEIVREGITGFIVEKNNIEQLSNRLKMLLDTEYRNTMKKRISKSKYFSKFTIDNTLLAISNIYNNL